VSDAECDRAAGECGAWGWGVYPDAWTCVIEHKQTENRAAAIVSAAEEKALILNLIVFKSPNQSIGV
jgi:hypothetical protein